MSDELFDDDPIAKAFRSQRRKALAAVDGMPVDALLAHPLDDLVEEVMSIYRIHPLAVDWRSKTSELTDTPHRDDTDGTSTSTRVTYFIPYAGSTGLFHLRPTGHRGKPPRGIVRPDELLLSFSADSADPSIVRGRLTAQESSVRRWVAWINADVTAFDRDLAAEVRDRLAGRVRKARADADLLVSLGLPAHERPAGPRRNRPLWRTRGPEASSSPPPSVDELPSVGQGHAGRPSWTRATYAEHLEAATKAAGESHTLAAVARHFRALDGETGISPEWLGRLQRRFHIP